MTNSISSSQTMPHGQRPGPAKSLCLSRTSIFSTKYGIPEYQKGGSLANLFEPLWNLFIRTCRDHDAGQIICILDALDKCAASHKRIIATNFAEFCSSNPTGVNFRIFITSRIDNALQAAFDSGSKSKATFVRSTSEGGEEVAAIAIRISDDNFA
ncbi:hypothetical protein BGZ60DRAFT_435552 [Tricladium varicosporioides]|nr:hypothetical protein BGZ60DRAFT_435552 [Hymenoscyphus varicosporioides]